MAGKNINIYIDFDAWKKAKELGLNISEICSQALISRVNSSNTSPLINLDHKLLENQSQLSQMELSLSEIKSKIKDIESQKQQIITQEKEAKKNELRDKLLKEKRSEYIREAIKKGIKSNKDIQEYIDSKITDELSKSNSE